MNIAKQHTQNNTRLYALDGLRGIAAVCVVLYHLIETYMNSSVHIINHAYLAVDFFFLLSGYVVSYAYDSKWKSNFNFLSFIKLRLIRLHPLVIFATIIGGLAYLLQDCPIFPQIQHTSCLQILRNMIMGIFFIPSTSVSDIRGWGEMFCLNSPQWTLFFEYIANIIYALFLRKLSNKQLLLLTTLCALLVLNTTLNLNIFGLLGERGSLAYTIIGGWCWTSGDILIGLTRLLFPFLCGMLLQRLHYTIRCRHNFLISVILLLFIFFIPKLPGIVNGIFELICIIILFPILILLANTYIPSKYHSFCNIAGKLSYPMYITHFPIVYLQIAWVSLHPNANLIQNVIVTTIAFIVIFILAILSHYFIEVPSRKKLLEYFNHS